MVPTMRHPDGLFCPICGCGQIVYWPIIEEKWDKWTDEEKREYEVCPCCGYGELEIFPEEEEEWYI